MTSFDEASIGEIEGLFGQLRDNSFAAKSVNAIPYEVQDGSAQVNPAGFTSDGGVEEVVSLSWVDFINSGFYNNGFGLGTILDIVAATKVGTASTTANYLSSISRDLPYWVVDSESGAGTFKRIADTTAQGGFALQWDGVETAKVFQDIPIIPGRKVQVFINWRYTNASSEFTRTAGHQFRASDHSAIGAVIEDGLAFSTSQAAYAEELIRTTAAAPATARYLRVFFESARTSGSPTVWLNNIRAETVWQIYAPGSSFPTSPNDDDRMFRTDDGVDEEYFYDGTRWMTTVKFDESISNYAIALPLSATGMFGRIRIPKRGTDIWIVDITCSFRVGGGTALDASNKWVITYDKYPSITTIATQNIDFGGSTIWRTIASTTVSALAGANYALEVTATKTGTPGDLVILPGFRYRVVQT